MLTSDSLASVLLAVATGDPARAAGLVAESTEIDEETRAVLQSALTAGKDSSTYACGFGDALRSLGADRNLVNECYRVAFYAGDGWKALSENPLYAFHVANKGGNSLDKWVHYFPIYERHLSRYRGQPVRVLEIGVSRGGGLELLRQFLGSACHLVGIDIDEAAQLAIGSRYPIELGDQADPGFLRGVSDRHGPFDVVIDDGGHFMRQQITSVETLFPLLNEGATYVVEDCHTSYWPEYSDRDSNGPTFLAWAKERIDDLHAYHFSTEKDLAAPWQTDLMGLHVYDSVVVFDKGHREAPFCEVSGTKEYINYARPAVAVELELISGRDAAVARSAKVVAEVEARVAMLDARAGVIDVRARALDSVEAQLTELDELRDEAKELAEELDQARLDRDGAWGIIRVMRRSKSWRLTAPIRGIKHLLRRS